MASKKPKQQPKLINLKSPKEIFSMLILAAITCGLLWMVYLICKRVYYTHERLIPLSVVTLILGAMFEHFRLCKNWKLIFKLAGFCLLVSLVSFIPGKHEDEYNLNSHIVVWPYFFLLPYVLFVVATNKDKATTKLTEGVTFLHSIIILYWIYDLRVSGTQNVFIEFGLPVAWIFALFSAMHAFSNLKLTRGMRLTLSIWNSLIMIVLAIANVMSVYQNKHIEDSNISIGLVIGLQYFLLGVSSIYMARNFYMIYGFMPDKKRGFNKEYREDAKKLAQDHIERYSEEQLGIIPALFCLIFAVPIFTFNYYHQFVSRNIAIWMVIVLTPYTLGYLENAFRSKSLK